MLLGEGEAAPLLLLHFFAFLGGVSRMPFRPRLPPPPPSATRSLSLVSPANAASTALCTSRKSSGVRRPRPASGRCRVETIGRPPRKACRSPAPCSPLSSSSSSFHSRSDLTACLNSGSAPSSTPGMSLCLLP